MSAIWFFKTVMLFFVTALTEIVGCYLPYLWLNKNGSPWLLVPTALSLLAFIWLLTLHPAESGRVYAAYGGVYVVTALIWLRLVDGASWTIYDFVGAGLTLSGMLVIVLGWSQSQA